MVADRTGIEWTDATWNPVTGCDEVSPGCAHCYAKTFAERWRGTPGHPYEQGFDLTLRPERLDQPLRWTRPRMVFVNSMSDLFHEEIPDEFIRRVFHTMAITPRHTYQVLTKRPERMRDLLQKWATPIDPAECCDSCVVCWHDYSADFPLPNVWLGVSIENRRFVHRADLLRQTPAAVRFVSAEPLLGPLVEDGPEMTWEDDYEGPGLMGFKDIDWLIVGGESGPGHRPIKPEWVRMLRDCCLPSCANCEQTELSGGHTAFFFKQWGGPRATSGGRELDGRTWDEMPQSHEADRG